VCEIPAINVFFDASRFEEELLFINKGVAGEFPEWINRVVVGLWVLIENQYRWRHCPICALRPR